MGQVQNEESLLEICLECNGVAAEMIEQEGDIPDYDVVGEIVGQSQVKNPDDIPRACAFVQLYGEVGEVRCSLRFSAAHDRVDQAVGFS